MNFVALELAGFLFVLGEWVIRVGVLPVIPYRRSPVTAKSWLLLIFFEPWVGLVLYLFFGGSGLSRWRRRRFEKLREATSLPDPSPRCARYETHPEPSRSFEQAIRLAENLGRYPILGGNGLELLSNYWGTIERLVEDIDGAEGHVHLLFYIFADDETTAPVIEALGRAAARGVKCRVLVDAIGSRPWLRTLLPKLQGFGVEVETALPLNPWRRAVSRPDLRNHRKVVVVDGRVGYTGSQNLISAETTPGLPNQELVARITGPIVLQLQAVFATDWYVEREELATEDWFPPPVESGDVAAQALPSGPAYPRGNNQRLMVSLIHGAKRRVVITTPYFIPDDPFLQALETAVLRGVEVLLIVSEKSDQLLVDLAQRSYYQELLESGVKIYQTEGKFLHAKHLSIDGELVLIGSSNVDIRSFHLNDEISLLVYDEGVARQLASHEQEYLDSATELTLQRWGEQGVVGDFFQHVARLFSPLL